METANALTEGSRALADGDWAAARSAFAAAVGDGAAEALEGYGLACWFLGELEEALEARQRACLAYGERGDCDRAARLAVWISNQYRISGRVSLANGWLERAERALEGHGDCAGAGWVAVERARRADVDGSRALATTALELGRSCRDADLEVFALTALGQAEIAAGAFDAGMRRLEEAMAAATAGRVANPHTLGEAYCNMIAASAGAGDWERATEWCGVVDEYARTRRIFPLHASCRTVHAEVLAASGRWDEAEVALREALESYRRHYRGSDAPTVAALALLRIRQGRLGEAAELLAARDESPSCLLALAELRHAEGEPRLAVGLLERALAGSGGDVHLSSRIRSSLVDALLASGSVGEADDVLAALESTAPASGGHLVRARAELAGARVARARGDAAQAAERAKAALGLFAQLHMPHETAEARVELACALAGDRPELALEDARSALEAFRGLGALRSREVAAAALRSLGVAPPGGGRSVDELTEREREVLALLARGLTNAQIGRTLFISEKTAGHHVSSILAKLGVRNRAEAATHAARLAGVAGEQSGE